MRQPAVSAASKLLKWTGKRRRRQKQKNGGELLDTFNICLF